MVSDLIDYTFQSAFFDLEESTTIMRSKGKNQFSPDLKIWLAVSRIPSFFLVYSDRLNSA